MAKPQKAATLPKEIAPAYQLWTRGDVAAARKEAKRVLAGDPEGEAAALARRLLDDTRAEPGALRAGVASLTVAAVVLVLLVRAMH